VQRSLHTQKSLTVSVSFKPEISVLVGVSHQNVSGNGEFFKLEHDSLWLVSLHTKKCIPVSVSFKPEMTICVGEFAHTQKISQWCRCEFLNFNMTQGCVGEFA
jgi:hypothetical protein